MASPTRPHFGFPFQRQSSSLAKVEQDTDEHDRAQNLVIIYCPIGFRVDRPEFGWAMPDLTQGPLDLTSLENALTTFGPQQHVDVMEYADAADAAHRHVRVEVQSEDTHG